MSKFLFLLEYKSYIDSIVNNGESEYGDEYIFNSMKENERNNILIVNEGLIYSQPIDITIRVLKNKFDELIIDKHDDGEISIQRLNNKLGKYLPLINNLGYFISSILIDDDIIDFDNDNLSSIKCDSIFIEPKYDYEVKTPNILYHTSPIKFKNKILNKGLTPKSGNKIANHPDRIYLNDSLKSAKLFGKYLIKNDNNKYYENGYCIYSVNGNGIDKLYSDVNFREGGFYTLNNISKEYIEIIDEK